MAEFFRGTSLESVTVLGHQITLTRNVKYLRETGNAISVESRINASAAGELYDRGYTKRLVYPTGYTVGHDLPSEAELVDREVVRLFKVPAEHRILRPESLDTAGDVRVSISVFKECDHKNVGIVSLNRHAQNAATLFGYYGHPIPKENVFASEQIVYMALKEEDKVKAEQFLKDFNYFAFLSGINLRESIRSFLLATIDKRGNLLGAITKRTRG